MTRYRQRRRGHRPPRCGPGLWAGLAAVAALAALLVAAGAAEAPPAQAQESARFVSLKAEVANLRVGPGRRYPIDWVYRKPGLPLLVVAHFDQWRWVQDHEGTKGWMHRSLLSTARTALVVDAVQTVREEPSSDAAALLRAEPGVIAELKGCEGRWCRIALAGEEGWVREDAIWGAVVPAP